MDRQISTTPVDENRAAEAADRDQTRRIVQGAVEIFLSVVLYTPGNVHLNLDRLWEEAKGLAVRAAREFRIRQRNRSHP